ncbi:hypothetical protein D3C75_790160 [compost metagenome]
MEGKRNYAGIAAKRNFEGLFFYGIPAPDSCRQGQLGVPLRLKNDLSVTCHQQRSGALPSNACALFPCRWQVQITFYSAYISKRQLLFGELHGFSVCIIHRFYNKLECLHCTLGSPGYSRLQQHGSIRLACRWTGNMPHSILYVQH